MEKKAKFAKCFLSTCLFLIATSTHANYICNRTGAITECGEGVLENLHVAGRATLRGTKVLGETHISGLLDAKNTNLNNFYMSGKATFISSQIHGTAKISGLLLSCQSKFSQKLTISSDRTYLEGSDVEDVEINRGGDVQVLYLGNQTVVHGNITFTENRGLVVIDNSSKIYGRVIGGHISNNSFKLHCNGVQYEKD